MMAMDTAKHFMSQKNSHSLHTPTYPDQPRPYLGHLLADTPLDRQSRTDLVGITRKFTLATPSIVLLPGKWFI